MCASHGVLALVIVALLVRVGRAVFFAKRQPFKQQPGTARLMLGSRLAAAAWIVLTAGIGVLVSRLSNETMLPTHAIDRYFVLINVVAAICIFFSLFAIFAGCRVWRLSDVRFISKLKFSLVAVACLFLSWFSLHWHLLGPAHRF